MRKHLTKGVKILLKLISGILLFIASYFFVAGTCTLIPVNSDYKKPANGITIAVYSNGVHTDIAVPAKNEIYDWTKSFSYSSVKQADSTYNYISFGWGDKGFFINTPTWADLKASTAFKAMFWLSSSAMHVTWKKTPVPGLRCRMITISKEKYALLCNYIAQTFQWSAAHLPEYIKAPGYGDHDAFYEARGTYNLFQTCNVWTGTGLKLAGIKVAVWTPFEKNLFYQLPD